MVHRKVVRSARHKFYEDLILRGDTAEYVSYKDLESWVDGFGDDNSMARVQDIQENGNVYACFRYESAGEREFPPHYHDVEETFKVLSGSMTMEFIKDNKRQKAILRAGDVLSIEPMCLHRGTVHEPMIAKLLFKKKLDADRDI